MELDVKIVHMKKMLTTLLAVAMAVSLASCTKKQPSQSSISGSGTQAVSGSSGVKAGSNTSSVPVSYTIENGDIIFTVSGTLGLADDSWIGICAKGSYVYEDDADDASVTYSFFEERESENDDFVFKIMYEGVEDGDYTMVLCDTDNEGYVMASWPLSIRNGTPAVDLSGSSLNPKPEGMPPKTDPAESVDPGEDGDDEGFDGNFEGPDGEEPDDGADDA